MGEHFVGGMDGKWYSVKYCFFVDYFNKLLIFPILSQKNVFSIIDLLFINSIFHIRAVK